MRNPISTPWGCSGCCRGRQSLNHRKDLPSSPCSLGDGDCFGSEGPISSCDIQVKRVPVPCQQDRVSLTSATFTSASSSLLGLVPGLECSTSFFCSGWMVPVLPSHLPSENYFPLTWAPHSLLWLVITVVISRPDPFLGSLLVPRLDCEAP